jgi:hypothetical protein
MQKEKGLLQTDKLRRTVTKTRNGFHAYLKNDRAIFSLLFNFNES